MSTDHTTPESAQLPADQITDALPEDLDVTGFVGPYLFPDNSRRRWPGGIYLVSGALMLGAWAITRGGDPVAVNRGVGIAGVVLIIVGAYHLVAGNPLAVREVDALTAASTALGFPVGHASAQLSWRGLLSRPTWRILMYSAEEPPKQRAMALVDGVDAQVIGHLVEDNPEDWSVFAEDGKLTAPPA